MSSTPDLLPILARGKHRSPRRGACFMELASFLAGERWSDHPACAHPLLAEVARQVNDRTTDAARPALAPLIPSVIGLVTDDPRADARIALQCALTALPVVASESQRSLAVGVLACERQLTALQDPHLEEVRQRVEQGFAQVPEAARWAASFTRRRRLDPDRTSVKSFRRHGARGIVQVAARSLEVAAVPSPDEQLRAMLTGAIEQCREVAGAHLSVEPVRSWGEAVALTR